MSDVWRTACHWRRCSSKPGSINIMKKKFVWGDIALVDRERNYHVEIEIFPGKTITAICPLNRVGLRDQSSPSFSVGMKRAFHVRRVDPVVLGRHPETQSNGRPGIQKPRRSPLERAAWWCCGEHYNSLHQAICGTKEFCRNLQKDPQTSNCRCGRGTWRATTGQVYPRAMNS